jgi:hypothetical protein
MSEKPFAPQMAQVRSAVHQFPGLTALELALATLIPIATLHRRLADLSRLGFVAKDEHGGYHVLPTTPADFPPLRSELEMQWEFVNAMTFESATHRVRHVGDFWLAERKSSGWDKPLKIGDTFSDQRSAESACEADAYSLASGR